MKFLIGRRFLKELDYIMLGSAIAIVCFSVANVFSATHSKYGFSYFELQSLWLLIGLAAVYIILIFDYKTISSYCGIIYWSGIALLLFNDVTSRSVKGASSWIRIGNRAIEPGEFVKIGLILMLSKKIDDMEGDIHNKKNFFILCFYAAIPMILILVQPNLGMTLICFFITLAMFFISNLNLKVIIYGFLAMIPLSLLIWFSGLMKTYQKDRIISFLNPDLYQQDTAFQLMQSITGIGSGGIFGTGFLKGLQVSGGYIPEVHTDFIFAVVGEEWGLIGAIVLLILYGILLYRMIKAAKESKDIFGRLICAGTAAAFMFSVYQNIGMTIGLMPIAGITLPFMSYGGSSILTNFISLGLVLNVCMRKKKINF